MVEEEDEQVERLGPNPKIRNMSRAYREGKGDLIWVIDCNVWVGKRVLRRMVARLTEEKRPNKFVHHLPIVVDVEGPEATAQANGSPNKARNGDMRVSSTSTRAYDHRRTRAGRFREAMQFGGGRLEECVRRTTPERR